VKIFKQDFQYLPGKRIARKYKSLENSAGTVLTVGL